MIDEVISDYPAMQAEDDGFLRNLQMSVIEPHLETLDFSEGDDYLSRASFLIAGNEDSTDEGSSLPLYLPIRTDDGLIRLSKSKAVWSGAHVGFPLYGDLAKEEVEALVYGSTSYIPRRLSKELLELQPAFRVALIVHHIEQNVVIPPLAAEAFVLGVYGEVSAGDDHFKTCGIPSTQLFSAHTFSGMRAEWVMDSPTQMHGCFRAEPRCNGWDVRFRGGAPKESLFRQAWRSVRDEVSGPHDLGFTLGGEALHTLESRPRCQTHTRSGSAKVDRMVQWVDSQLADGRFPMRGSRMDWKLGLARFELTCPQLAGRWSPDGMRRVYAHRKQMGDK